MKQAIFIFLVAVFIISCNYTETKRPTAAMEVGTTFIRATLDGDFKTAESLLYKDSLNEEFFKAYKISFEAQPKEKKESYKAANYNINTFTETNDTVNIIDYSNSFMKQNQKIKLIKKAAQWSVDFKYTTGDTTTVTK